ncbi:MAG: hypothetical protein ACXWID_09815 [Pyrinomonadaceae bacterium]
MFARIKTLQILRFTLACALVLFTAMWLSVQAQPGPTRPIPQPSPNPMDGRRDGIDFGNRETDTRTRMILKKEKKEYEEHVERAQEARDLAAELQKTYEIAHSFNAADYKKLERLEKLTRRVRNEAGGSQTDADPKELPGTHDEAVSLLADMAKELCDEVENTPRRVVSASIINQANKLIALIQFVRGTRD